MNKRSREANSNWTETPAYKTVHMRLLASKGPAKLQVCVECGEPAKDWAYDHTDSDAVTDQRGRTYSTNLDKYQPMCKGCHERFDRPPITHCKAGHEFNEANTYIRPNGTRQCRECRNRRVRETYRRKKEC